MIDIIPEDDSNIDLVSAAVVVVDAKLDRNVYQRKLDCQLCCQMS